MKPFSSDPMDYDYYIHHYAFTSVFGKLVSLEKKGQVTPLLAEKWSHDNDFKTWTFTIRPHLFYSNGDLITPKDIALNFTRMAFLKNKTNSQSGLLEFLIGFNSLKSAHDTIEGISYNQDQVVFKFIKPIPDLLSKISFGFYSLTHPSLYNLENGEWINKKLVISSGPYDVSEWTDSSFNLTLRKDLPYVDYKKAISKIHFQDLLKAKKSTDLKDIDIIVADKTSLMVDDTFNYTGSSVGLKIGYAQVYTWNKPGPMNDINVRKWLRQKFYNDLNSHHFSTTKSFFPLSLKNLHDISDDVQIAKPNYKPFKLITHTMNSTAKIIENSARKSMAELFDSALSSLNGDDVTLIKNEITDDSDLEKFDVVINGTGVEADEYWDTVRFMFLSKQGIKLPDASGKILAELKKANPDINVINRELWDQAIIWPIRHYTNGFWLKKEPRISFDEVNLDGPAIDFQFIHWK